MGEKDFVLQWHSSCGRKRFKCKDRNQRQEPGDVPGYKFIFDEVTVDLRVRNPTGHGVPAVSSNLMSGLWHSFC